MQAARAAAAAEAGADADDSEGGPAVTRAAWLAGVVASASEVGERALSGWQEGGVQGLVGSVLGIGGLGLDGDAVGG